MTAYAHGLGAGRVLEALGNLPDRSYPAFRRPKLPVPRPAGDTATLGSLPWPELGGLGPQERERIALSLVARALEAAFNDHYRTFRFGKTILSAQRPPAGVDAAAWWRVRGFLRAAAKMVGAYAAADNVSSALLVGDPHPSLWRQDTWVRAGLARTCVLRAWRREPDAGVASLGRLGLQCLGATIESTVAAAGGFVAYTGWNKQPVLDLPRRFVTFETEDGSAAVGDTAHVASFKRRAGHPVLAALQKGPLRGLIAKNATASWETAAATERPGPGEFLDLKRHSRALNFLERSEEMADASRKLDPKCDASDLLFVFPFAHADGAEDFCDRRGHLLSLLGGAILSRQGVRFPALRATRINVEHARIGSAEAVASRAGHRQAATAMQRYLRTAAARETWDAHVRFFQDACQAVLLDGRPDAISIMGLPPQDVAWCRRLASASGIALVHAAFGQPRATGPRTPRSGSIRRTRTLPSSTWLTGRSARRRSGCRHGPMPRNAYRCWPS